MTDIAPQGTPTRWAMVAAFATIYLFWGAVYLGIAFAIETIPPFLMMGTRVMMAGGLLYAWARWRGAPPPTPVHWRSTAVSGALLIAGGVGVGAWAQQWVPSGLTGVLIGTIPLWMVLLDWVFGGNRPGAWVTAGLLVGLGGIALIVGPDALGAGDGSVNLFGATVMIGAALMWAAGSLYAIRAPMPDSVLLVTGMQMLVGGAMLLAAAPLAGELAGFRLSAVSPRSALAMVWLLIFPGILAFSAYNWLLRVSSPARVSTYAYVNPVVALFLGWALGGETLTGRMLAGSAIILLSVAVITVQRAPSRGNQNEPEAEAAAARA